MSVPGKSDGKRIRRVAIPATDGVALRKISWISFKQVQLRDSAAVQLAGIGGFSGDTFANDRQFYEHFNVIPGQASVGIISSCISPRPFCCARTLLR